MPFRKLFSCFLFVAGVFTVCPAFAMDDAILAVVNEEVITVKDLQDYLRGVASELKIDGKNAEEAARIMQQYQSKGIQQLVEDRLILSAADKAGVQIRPQAIETNGQSQVAVKMPASGGICFSPISAPTKGMNIGALKRMPSARRTPSSGTSKDGATWISRVASRWSIPAMYIRM